MKTLNFRRTAFLALGIMVAILVILTTTNVFAYLGA